MNEKSTAVKLGFGRQLGFALGESAGQFFFGFWGSFLSLYYTDVVGLAPAIVSVIFIIARIWDAVNDPIMGNIADRGKISKFGRYRKWILYFVPVLAVLSLLVWRVPNVDSQSVKVIYVTITYILAVMFGLLFSMLATFGRLGVAVYYYLYDLHAFTMVGVLMVIPTACAIIPSYLIPKLQVSRKKLIIIAFIGRAASLIALYCVDFANIKAVIVCLVLVGFFNYETGMLTELIPPAIDDAEVRTGKRMDGTVFAMVNLFAKLASAIGASIGLFVMGAMGYVANAEQTASAMKGINIAVNILPGIFCAIAIIPIAMYSLNSEKMKENAAILAKKHANRE